MSNTSSSNTGEPNEVAKQADAKQAKTAQDSKKLFAKNQQAQSKFFGGGGKNSARAKGRPAVQRRMA